MAERLAIVGGDAAGMSAASTARRRQPALDVVAFERGPYTSFSACGIPFYIGGLFDDSDRLVTRSPDEHRERGIAVHTRTTVTAVDLDRRELTVRDQSGGVRREGFDQLVLATGAEAVAPDVPGAETAEPARTIDAAERFRAALAQGGKSAVVIGCGYIGLEMAEALVQRGLRVTLVERAGQVMLTLDEDMAAHVQDAAEGIGIDVRLGAELQEVSDTPSAWTARSCPPITSSWRRACARRRASRATRGSSSATAARCASTTASAARGTRASSPRATASSRGTGCSSAP
jgi:NADPH-dependent 2,4-dienoyl-CoA reductase/sulfur reductase-like enzyme